MEQSNETIAVEKLRQLADAKFWEAHRKISIKETMNAGEITEVALLLGQAETWQYLMGYLNDYSGNGKS